MLLRGLCLYTAMYVCVCVCIHAHTHTHTYTRMHTHAHTLSRVCVCVCVYYTYAHTSDIRQESLHVTPSHTHGCSCMSVVVRVDITSPCLLYTTSLLTKRTNIPPLSHRPHRLLVSLCLCIYCGRPGVTWLPWQRVFCVRMCVWERALACSFLWRINYFYKP